MLYAIVGATGHTGHMIADRLLAAGKDVRVQSRDAAKLRPFVDRGAKPVVGSIEDRDTLVRLFSGAHAVYAMLPPDVTTADPIGLQAYLGENIAGALREMRVRFCVNLSSFGAQNRTSAGPVSGLGRQEERLNAISDLTVLHLRPAFFMENLLNFVPMIRQGFIALPVMADLPMPFIATRDIGEIAATELLELQVTGHSTRELLGPRDLTWTEVAGIIGKAIGKPDLRYVQASYEDAEKGMIEAGLRPALAAAYVEMYRAINERRMKALEPRSDRNTTPTTIEQWVQTDLVPALR